ncbi:hypothetical protein DYB26_013682 [Aphanomyces astaci]|uniref:DDE Tnp4 domain-containing protein n=1 Tax=Aphanomyces astaci TaxID=112090 RepID=A0A397CHH0_APHAT|nr:hypothetical protein DYB38_008528 [Aphanomyces astaci]RHZ27070.1 hypothetical protein DYB26_013682 [Aphanomyces astaci]
MLFLIVFQPYLMRTFVMAVEQKWPMQALTEWGIGSRTFRLLGTPLSNGFAIDYNKFYKGSVSDKTSFDESIDSHLANLAKRTGEMTLEDSEPGMEQWAVLAGKGYQAIEHNVRAMLPLKKPVGGILTFAGKRRMTVLPAIASSLGITLVG